MQDAFAYCAELLRAADHDRFIAALFAPPERRGALHALYAFNAELARVRDVAHAALPGEVRLQWWSEVINGERAGEAAANPVASALLTAAERHSLASAKLMELIEARRFDLYDDPMASVADLESYARHTSSTLIELAAQVLGGVDAKALPAAEPAGIAYAVVVLLQAFPRHVARRQLYVPLDVLERHDVRLHDLYAGRSSAGLEAALTELRNLARRYLADAAKHMRGLPQQTIPAFLPVALTAPTLDRLERSSAFAPAELPAWRRQWLMWRAARNPNRIAG
jgi:15-cis-phytoene synthase